MKYKKIFGAVPELRFIKIFEKKKKSSRKCEKNTKFGIKRNCAKIDFSFWTLGILIALLPVWFPRKFQEYW